MHRLSNFLNYFFAVIQWADLILAIIASIFVFCGFEYSVCKIYNLVVSSIICYLLRWVIPILLDKIEFYFDNRD